MQHPTMNSSGAFPFVPGANKVLFQRGKSTEFYCETCRAYIQPIWVRKGEHVYAACIACLYNDMSIVNETNKGELGDALEDAETTPAATA